MYQLDWNIEFKNPSGKKYRLTLLYSVEIDSSVENLVDTAIITIPEAVLNKVLSIENKIPRGTEVVINLGYNGKLHPEFKGFVKEIKNNSSTLTIECEDSIFKFRKPVSDEVLKPTSVSQIAQRMIDQCDPAMVLSCDYDISYEKFVIHQANAFDVLKKLQEETKANIWIDSETNTLHIHAPFIEKSGTVKYNATQNVQSISLEYKRALDRKYEITVQSIGVDGQIKEIKSGSTGGESVTMKVGPMSEIDMKKIGDAELSKRMADRFEGSIDTWLIPIIKPTATAMYDDHDYPDKKGGYYVPSVKISFSASGAVRTVNFGIKVS
jgi:hypothetical protein